MSWAKSFPRQGQQLFTKSQKIVSRVLFVVRVCKNEILVSETYQTRMRFVKFSSILNSKTTESFSRSFSGSLLRELQRHRRLQSKEQTLRLRFHWSS